MRGVMGHDGGQSTFALQFTSLSGTLMKGRAFHIYPGYVVSNDSDLELEVRELLVAARDKPPSVATSSWGVVGGTWWSSACLLRYTRN